MDDVTRLRDALVTKWYGSDALRVVFSADLDTLIAAVEARAARRAIEGSGVVRTVQAKRPPSGVDSHMAGWVRWDKPMDPITRLLANLDYESYEVDAVGGGKVRCWKFSEWPDTLRRAVETVRAALPRPEEPRVERVRGTDNDCSRCGAPLRTIDPEYEPGGRVCDDCGLDSRDTHPDGEHDYQPGVCGMTCDFTDMVAERFPLPEKEPADG